MRRSVAGLGLAVVLAACGTAGEQEQAGARAGAPAAAPAAQAVYLDVRTPAEYAEGHVAGTLHIPIDELEQRWEELSQYRDEPVVVYCRSGRRSAAAIEILRAKGFTRLENGGGLSQMAARGLPLEPEGCC